VFCNSEIYCKEGDGTFLQGHVQSINRVDIPVGDASYPLLLETYLFHSTLSAAQKSFNYKLSRAKTRSFRDSIGQLKARWHRLLKASEIWPENILEVIAVSCVLHNICMIYENDINDMVYQ